MQVDSLAVQGGGTFQGKIATSGFKHSLVGIISAALAADRSIEIGNVPDIMESRVLARIAGDLGAEVDWQGNRLRLDCAGLRSAPLDPALTGSIHGTMYLLPSLVGRFGRAAIRINGGCQIGTGAGHRPIQHCIDVMERFGARARLCEDGTLDVTASKLTGCDIDLLDYARDRQLRTGHMYSGATKTALLCAVAAKGVSVLRHPYPKPDITDIIEVLTAYGADLETERPDTVVVHGRGVAELRKDVTHTLVPDLIEVFTWICAGTVLGTGPLRITGPAMDRALDALAPDLAALHEMGVRFEVTEQDILLQPGRDALRAVEVTAASHGVFSDNQPFLALLATWANGVSGITDTVWTDRFGYLPGLVELGCRLEQRGSRIEVTGLQPPVRSGRRVHGSDLRAAAALLLAAAAIPGRTVVTGTSHLARGYPDLAGSLRSLGVDIRPVGAAPAGPLAN